MSTRRILFFGILSGLVSLPGLMYAGVEDDQIAVLSSGAAAPKIWSACQILRRKGTAKSVPALAALLGRERLSQAACHALEAIPGPEAGAALRTALAATEGPLRAGLVDSLGWRRDRQAVPLIIPLLQDSDPDVAGIAATALGRIGGENARSALVAARKRVVPKARLHLWEALLVCAERLRGAGKPADAIRICALLMTPDKPAQVRAAAWRGTVLADEAERPRLMVAALSGADVTLRTAAVGLLRSLNDTRVLRACARNWNDLPPLSQLAVVDTHIQLGGEGLAVVMKATRSQNLGVRIAAWQGLGRLNEVPATADLAKAAAHGDGAERDAARDALLRLHGPDVRHALFAALSSSDSGVRVELLRVIGRRGEPGATQVLLDQVRSEDEAVRQASLQALGSQPATDALGPLLALWSGLKSKPERNAWKKAVARVCAAGPDPNRSEGIIIAAMRDPQADFRTALLPALCRLGSARALATVQAATDDADTGLSTEAVRVLAQWPTIDAAPVLLAIARTQGDLTRHALALRGYVAVTRFEKDPARLLHFLREGMKAAARVEEKRLVIGRMGGIFTPEALTAVQGYLGDDELVDEASAAAVAIARALAGQYPDMAQHAADKVLATCRNEAIRNRALLLRAKPRSGPFIRHWLVCGPYSRPGVFGAEAVFTIPFGPEKAGKQVRWRAVPPNDMVNLSAYFPGKVNCVAYLKCRIASPRECEALLLMASDDGIKAWLNGAVVHSNNIDRGAVIDQDVAVVRLREGANELLLKVTQGAGGWAACARLVQINGEPFNDLTISTGDGGTVPVLAVPAAAPPKPLAKPAVPSELPPRDAFRRICLSDKFYAEGATCADINRDGALDVVAGPFWFGGPDFSERHAYRATKAFDPKGYSDNFLTFAADLNADGWVDIFCVPFPGEAGYWYENPKGKATVWTQHLAYPMIGNESPAWGDITGDGRPELIFCIDGYLGYSVPKRDKPGEPWGFTAISGHEKRYQRFTHGLGFGDINGDGRADVLEADGWYEQPAHFEPGTPWAFHRQRFAEAAAQMLVADVDGDGLADVITAWHCHHYGLLWYRQVRGATGTIEWRRKVILPPVPDIASTALRISQLHAQALVDMNGDGVKDILTGKRYWAHGPTGDVEPGAPAVLLWFEIKRGKNGNVSFVPHLIDDDSGVGTQVVAADLNGDKRPDVMVANKKGIFVHLSAK